MIVNELVTKFKFDSKAAFKALDTNLRKSVENTRRSAFAMGLYIEQMSKRIAKAAKIQMKLNGTKAVMRDLERIKALGSSIKSMFTGFGALAAGAVGLGGLTAGFAAMIKTGMEAETQLMKLTNIRGPEQARRDIRALNQMAAKTPYETGELVDSFQRLNAAGFKVDINAMMALGDIAAGSGKDMNMLTETMLSASRGQASMVDNFNGMSATAKDGKLEFQHLDSKTGKLTKKIFDASDKAALLAFYLDAAKRQDTAGSMERLSGTMQGLASTLQDAIAGAFRNFYNSGFGDALKGITKEAIRLTEGLQPLATQVGLVVAKNMRAWAKGLPELLSKIGTAAKIAAPFIALLVANMVGLRIVGLAASLYKVGTAIAVLGVKGWLASGGLTATAIAATALQIAIGGAFLLAIGAILDFNKYLETGDSWLLSFTEKWPWLHNTIKNVYTMVVAFGMGLMNLGGVAKYWGSIVLGVWNAVKMGFAALWNGIVSMAQQLWASLANIVSTIKQNFINAWNLIKQTAVNAGSAIASAVGGALQSIMNWLAQLPARAAAAFSSLVSAARNAAANMPVIGAAVRMLPGFATGGMVPAGYPNDSYVAGLTSGEVIVPPLAVQQIQRGDPAGFAKVAELARAPMPTTPQTYSMPAATLSAGSGGMGAMTLNAPINQVFNMNTGQQSPTAIARAVASEGGRSLRNELGSIARQMPRRVPAV